MVAYVWQRRPGRSDALINVLVLAGLIVPPAVVPTIWVLQKVGLFKTMPGLILVEIAFGLPFCILLFRAFIARSRGSWTRRRSIDGAGPIQIFFRVIFPRAAVGHHHGGHLAVGVHLQRLPEPALLPARRRERHRPAHAVQLPEPVQHPVQPALREHPARHRSRRWSCSCSSTARSSPAWPPARSRADPPPGSPTRHGAPRTPPHRKETHVLALDRRDDLARSTTSHGAPLLPQGGHARRRARRRRRAPAARLGAWASSRRRRTARRSPTTCSARAGAATSGGCATAPTTSPRCSRETRRCWASRSATAGTAAGWAGAERRAVRRPARR